MKKYTCILLCMLLMFSMSFPAYAQCYTYSNVSPSDYNRHRTLEEMQALALEKVGGGVSPYYLYYKDSNFSSRSYTTYYFEFDSRTCVYPRTSYGINTCSCGVNIAPGATLTFNSSGVPDGYSIYLHPYYQYDELSYGTFCYYNGSGNDNTMFWIEVDTGHLHKCPVQTNKFDYIITVPLAKTWQDAMNYVSTGDSSFIVNGADKVVMPEILDVVPYYDRYNKEMYVYIDNTDIENPEDYYTEVTIRMNTEDEFETLGPYYYNYINDKYLLVDVSMLDSCDSISIDFENCEDITLDSLHSNKHTISYDGGSTYNYSILYELDIGPSIETNTYPMNMYDDTLEEQEPEPDRNFFEKMFDDISNGISGLSSNISSGFSSLGSDIKNLCDDIGEWFQELIETILNIPTKILDGLKDLFIPSQEDLTVIHDKWQQLLKNRFGLLYECVELIARFVGIFIEREPTTTVTMPTVTIPLPENASYTFGGFEVNLIPEGFESVVLVVKNVISLVCLIAFINVMVGRLDKLLGGKEA